MQYATQAYQKAANETPNARELEANLLLKSAARLRAVCDNWEDRKVELGKALLFNRTLWTILLSAVTRDDNPLPIETRQNVASLGIFVINRTLKLTSNPQSDDLNALININCAIAAGLRGRA